MMPLTALTRIALRCAAGALVAGMLSACVSMSGLGGESKYACAAPEGVRCQSVSGTYANARREGSATTPLSGAPASATGSAVPARTRATGTGARATSHVSALRSVAPEAAAGGAVADAEPMQERSADLPLERLRSPSRFLRLWTKPWEDADGDLWDQGFVYVQVSSGAWRIEHVRQRAARRAASVRPPPGSAVASGRALADRPGQKAPPVVIGERSAEGHAQLSPFPTIEPTLPLATRPVTGAVAGRTADRPADRSVNRLSNRPSDGPNADTSDRSLDHPIGNSP